LTRSRWFRRPVCVLLLVTTWKKEETSHRVKQNLKGDAFALGLDSDETQRIARAHMLSIPSRV
jgi:hypothetical protein